MLPKPSHVLNRGADVPRGHDPKGQPREEVRHARGLGADDGRGAQDENHGLLGGSSGEVVSLWEKGPKLVRSNKQKKVLCIVP